MQLRKLKCLLDQMMADIEKAARKKDANAIIALVRELDKTMGLIDRWNAIAKETSQVLKRSSPEDGSKMRDEKPVVQGPESGEAEISAKAHGKQHRIEFVGAAVQRGVRLEPSKGVVYKTADGTRVGIAYADERRKNKWFLGLPIDGFQHAILLCVSNGKTTHFSLANDFIAQFGRFLTRKDGQIKFNVFKDGGRFFLRVPRQESIPIDQFRDNFYGLT
jgi:hypothetical protein